MNEKPLALRPHHALCLHYFTGHGYSGEFVENMFHIKQLLGEKSNREVVFHCKTDIICAACPNNREGECGTPEKVARYDAKCAEACGFSCGVPISWAECEEQVRTKILQVPGEREKICGDCLWKTLCQQQDVEKSVESV